MADSKIDLITVWNIPKDGSIKDFPASEFLKAYRFAKWYLSFNDPDNLFFHHLVTAVDLSILSLRMSSNTKLILDADILDREFCQEEVKTAAVNIMELEISRNTYFKHRDKAIKTVETFIQNYISSLE